MELQVVRVLIISQYHYPYQRKWVLERFVENLDQTWIQLPRLLTSALWIYLRVLSVCSLLWSLSASVNEAKTKVNKWYCYELNQENDFYLLYNKTFVCLDTIFAVGSVLSLNAYHLLFSFFFVLSHSLSLIPDHTHLMITLQHQYAELLKTVHFNRSSSSVLLHELWMYQYILSPKRKTNSVVKVDILSMCLNRKLVRNYVSCFEAFCCLEVDLICVQHKSIAVK